MYIYIHVWRERLAKCHSPLNVPFRLYQQDRHLEWKGYIDVCVCVYRYIYIHIYIVMRIEKLNPPVLDSAISHKPRVEFLLFS